jgi:hypothetical protein
MDVIGYIYINSLPTEKKTSAHDFAIIQLRHKFVASAISMTSCFIRFSSILAEVAELVALARDDLAYDAGHNLWV